jgi:hypothetical protein
MVNAGATLSGRSPCRRAFNPAFTMPPDSVNRVGFSAMDSVFR